MLNPFRALGKTLRDLFDEFLLLILCNLCWVVLSVPLWWLAYGLAWSGAFVPAVLVAMLGVLPAGPATMALTTVSLRVSEGRASTIADFFRGLRTYPRQAWALTAIWVAGMLLILFNFRFYFTWPGVIGGLILGVWVYLFLIWFALLIYAFPLLLLQERPDLRLVARNAGLMVLGRPLFTGVNMALMGVLVALSVVFVIPFLLITASLLNLWSVRATTALIEYQRARQEAAAEATAAAPPAEERGRKGQVRPK
jgi:uncharacterized membrane protein YesL